MKRFVQVVSVAVVATNAPHAFGQQTEPERPVGAVQIGHLLFSRLASQLPLNAAYRTMQSASKSGCSDIGPDASVSKGDGNLQRISLREYGPIFMQEMKAAGRGPASVNLFQNPDADAVDYEIGGLAKSLSVKMCLRPATWGPSLGSGDITVEWQVYSRATSKVVRTITTSGHYEPSSTTNWGNSDQVEKELIDGAFASSVKALAHSPELTTIVDAPAPDEQIASTPGKQGHILLAASNAAPQELSDAVGSVVLVRAEGAFGSGVLVSSDGYILTDAHVPGSSLTVTIRCRTALRARAVWCAHTRSAMSP